jgi:exodeoxyribonuclease V alpha subunit
VLRDLIDSGVIPTVVLRRIFRQDRQSLIVVNAHRILQGHSLVLGEQSEKRDFVFLPRESEEEILLTFKELLRERIPHSLQLESQEVSQAIQVLTPMHRGLLGTINLNREMQSLLNPAGETLERGGLPLRLGDKVMQLRNNYDKGVFNGDLGRIAGLDREEGSIKVDFYDKLVEYESEEMDEINCLWDVGRQEPGKPIPDCRYSAPHLALPAASPQHSLHGGDPREEIGCSGG